MAVYDEERIYNELINSAPKFEQSAEVKDSAAALIGAEGSFSNEEYKGGTADIQLDAAINKYLNDRGFDYNTANDADYQAFVKEYRDNAIKGQRLSKETTNTLANGYKPTYAEAVADEVYNSQLENVSDSIPQFKSLAAMSDAGNKQQLANAVSIYSNQSQRDYNKYRELVGDRKNFLNYLYARYAGDRQRNSELNAINAEIYGTRLSAAQNNLENSRNIANQKYLYNTISADSKAKLAQSERENAQKIAFQMAEDNYNQRVNSAKSEKKAQDKENLRRYKRNGSKYIEAYNLKNANYEYVTSQLAIGYANHQLSLGELDWIAEKLNISSEDIENKLDSYEKNGGSFNRRHGNG